MSVDDGLRPIFRRHLPTVDWLSVETGTTTRGAPDSNGCVRGVEFWVEYKSTAGYVVDLRPEQVGWILRRARHGGRVTIAVRRRHDGGPRRGPAVDELWLIPGELAMQARERGLRGLPDTTAHWGGGPARWPWAAVLAFLAGLQEA